MADRMRALTEPLERSQMAIGFEASRENPAAGRPNEPQTAADGLVDPSSSVAGPQRASVTEWVSLQKAGVDSSQKIWDRYVRDVVRACEARISSRLRRSVTGEDLAQEVFHDFFVGIRTGAFPRLENRGDVRQILRMLADRIAIDHCRHHRTRRAGGGKVLAFTDVNASAAGHNVDDVPAPPAGPNDEVELRDVLVALVPDLTDPLLQNLVCDRIMGFTVDETARRRGISARTVIRKLQLLIRSLRARGLSAP